MPKKKITKITPKGTLISRVVVVKGEKPVQGVDYKLPEDGYTPKKGVDYFDGQDGKTPTEEELLSLIIPRIPKPIPGKDGKDVPEAKVKKMVKEVVGMIEFPTIDIGEDQRGQWVEKDGKKMYIKSVSNIGAGMSTGVVDFIALRDTPSSYVGQGGKVVKVKSDETGLEFGIGGGGGGSVFVNGVEVTDPNFEDSAEIEVDVTGSDVSFAIVSGSIDETKLDASVNASLDLADSAVQPGALASYVPYTGATGDVNIGVHGLTAHNIKGDASDGLLIEANNGTDIGILGAGNTANGTWYGNHNFNTVTASRAAQFGASKTLESSSVTTTELGYVSGVTSAIQTQINAKMTNPMTTGGDVIYGGASGTPTRLANGTAGQVLTSAGGTSAPTWETPGGGGGSPYTLVATDTTEYTTTSTSAVDMVTISGLSIPQDKTIIIYYQFKQNTSSYAALGLKLNSTIVGEAYISGGGATALGEVGTETEQRIRFGMVQLGPRETGFSGPGSGFGTQGGSFDYPPVPLTPVSTNAQPEATITSITIRGISYSGSNTLSVKNIKILTM